MIHWWGGWRVALRIARREASRAAGRSTLVLLMIALPVAALAFTAVQHDTFTLSPTERADRLMGSAEAVLAWPIDAPVAQDPADIEMWSNIDPGQGGGSDGPASMDRLLALLPSGSRLIPDQRGDLRMATVNGTGTIDARALDYADPLAAGILRPMSGRAPAAADDVALTPQAATRLGAGVGGTVRLADGSRTFHVTAIVESPNDLTATWIVLRPGALAGRELDRQTTKWLAAIPSPLTWNGVRQLNTHGVIAVSREVLANPPGEDERYPMFETGPAFTLGNFGFFAGLGLLEVVLLAGPAFAVGARRRRRDLALVSASGGSAAHIRRIVLADGVVLGAAAAGAGVVLGIAAMAVARPLLETHLIHARAGAFRVFPAALAALALLAVLTGVLAALAPAWISARQDVVTALAGRRGITRSRRRWVVLGLGLAAAGVAVAALGSLRSLTPVILTGLAIGEVGLVLCTPAAVGLVARLGRFLPISPRIALRDASRNRTAAAPAISAVMAAVVASLAAGVLLVASAARAHDAYRSITPIGDVILDGRGKGTTNQAPLSDQTIATLRSLLPVGQVDRFGLPICGPGECFVSPQVPPANKCPYAELGRDATADEQRQARRDPRCAGVGQLATYFRYLQTDRLTIIADASAAAALTGFSGAAADQIGAALAAGKVVVDDPRLIDHGRVTLTVTSVGDLEKAKNEQSRQVTVDAYAMPSAPRAPVVIVPPNTARSIGLTVSMTMAIAQSSRIPTTAEQDRLQAALSGAFAYVERGPGPDPNSRNLLMLTIIASLITFGAAAIATGLAAVDGRPDLATLAAVGGSPRMRRLLTFSQAGVIAGLGSLLGAAAGVGASLAMLFAVNRGFDNLWPQPTPYPFIVPWGNVAIAVLVVPLIAMLGAGLLTRSRLPIERRP